MRNSLRFLAILACALPLACSDMSITPTATTPAPRLSANPASNGSVVLRFDQVGNFWVGWYDPARNLTAWQTSATMCPTEDPAATTISWQVVESGQLEGLYRGVGKSPDVAIYIYDGGPDTFDICKPPVMRGTGRIVTTGNDWIGGVGNGASTWGFRVNGDVSNGTGQTYRYSGHLRIVSGPSGMYQEEASINLKPVVQ